MATVLIIDDSGFQRSTIRRVVQAEGHQAIEAKNGVEGVSKAIELKPDFITLDLLMPEMDGVSTLAELKKKNIKIPVVVVTANIQETIRKECMDLGAVGFVNKPMMGPAVDTFKNLLKCYIDA